MGKEEEKEKRDTNNKRTKTVRKKHKNDNCQMFITYENNLLDQGQLGTGRGENVYTTGSSRHTH